MVKCYFIAKSKLNSIEVLISKALIDSNIIHDEFVLIYNALKEFYNNAISNKPLLGGDKFILEMHLKQKEFTYITCGSFTKNKERIKWFKETGD